ncbi:MAG: hypothetical protein GXY15_02100 [Candidatus Hydrogenedentes bacterium]|nr:hypothetical protein [Candidatus Hydrogenedentota bacterium]
MAVFAVTAPFLAGTAFFGAGAAARAGFTGDFFAAAGAGLAFPFGVTAFGGVFGFPWTTFGFFAETAVFLALTASGRFAMRLPSPSAPHCAVFSATTDRACPGAGSGANMFPKKALDSTASRKNSVATVPKAGKTHTPRHFTRLPW